MIAKNNKKNFFRKFISKAAKRIHATQVLYRTPPDLICLHLGYPDPLVFPLTDLTECTNEVELKGNKNALQYSEEMGDIHLRESLAQLSYSERISVNPENVLITHGATDAIEYLSQAILNPGDYVIMASPSYLWAIRTFQSRFARLRGVPTDDNGIVTDELEYTLKQLKKINAPIKLLYIIPDFQNPTGRTVPLQRRKEVMRLALEYNFLVLEDRPYVELRYEGRSIPSLLNLDRIGLVLQARTFSKILGPGIRLGWLIGPSEILKKVALMKATGTCTYTSTIVNHFIKRGSLDVAIDRAKKHYTKKWKVAIDILERNCPQEISWSKPEGGFYVWLDLPLSIKEHDLEKKLAIEGVRILGGRGFYCQKPSSPGCRIAFSYESASRIEKGLKKLCEILKIMIKLNSSKI